MKGIISPPGNGAVRIARGFLGALLFGALSVLNAQEPETAIIAYQRNFVRSNLATKIDILKDASADEKVAADLGSLYQFTLDFSLRHAELLREDADLIQLVGMASAGVGKTGYQPAVATLWRVFMAFRDTGTRELVLRSLAVLGKGDSQVIENLNQFLGNQNNLYRSGMVPDYTLLGVCVETLGILGDGSSFPVLFSAMIAGYPEQLTRKAASALAAIRGDYKKYLMDVLKKNPPVEKLAAFEAGIVNQGFSPAELGELAETALEISLGFFPAEAADQEAVLDLRYRAVRTLTELSWTRATTLAIKNFYRVQTDYGNSQAPKERFLEAIACLGSMGSSEAAQALALQLGLINSQMERNQEYDTELLMAVITALGDIGDKVAFDYLLYIGYLSYPDDVQTAAREAMNRLKW